LNWFNVEKIKEEYNFYNENDRISNIVKDLFLFNETQEKITHKEFINKITNKNNKQFIMYN
jgi:hypothetical protein